MRHDEVEQLLKVGRHGCPSPFRRGAGWLHTPTSEDLVGTSYGRDQIELQLTSVIPETEGGVVVPLPGEPLMLSTGPWPSHAAPSTA